jgi:hypothetical protein
MKIYYFLFFLLFLNYSFSQNKNLVYYVSVFGNDNWSGKIERPNNDDGPFRTINRAVIEIEKLKKNFFNGNVEIRFKEGEYYFSNGLKFIKNNSGDENFSITFTANGNEKVSFIGAKKIIGFTKVKDPSILNRFSKNVRNKIYECNLKDNDLFDYGVIKPQGFGRTKLPLQMELFFDQKPMLLAQYPDKEWLIITDVPQEEGTPKNPGEEKVLREGIPSGRHFGKFKFNSERTKLWKEISDIWMHGYFTWDWADSYDKVKSFDYKNNVVIIDEPYNHYGYVKGQRFRFINVLEELDIPREYYIDRKKGVLYFYPPSNINEGDAYVSTLNDIMVSFDSCSNISFRNIKFQYSRTSAVKISNSKNINFSGCSFSNFGNDVAIIEKGENCGFLSCDFYDNAAGAVFIDAGDRFTLTPANNYITNCKFHDFGRIYRTYAPAISLNGVGNTAKHNHIYDAPHMGIYFIGNDHLIEYNEIDHIAKETGDVGAIYTGRDYTSRGTIVRYNYLHELHGPGLCGVMGVYLDDFSSGIYVYGNVFYKAGHALMVGGGRNNIIENNIFIDCDPSIFIDGRGMYRNVEYFNGKYNALWDKVKLYKIKEPPYSVKYPELVNIEIDEPAIPKYNKILNNISYKGRFLDLYSGIDFRLVEIKSNLISDPIILRRSERSDIETEKFTNYDITDKEIVYKFSLGNNIISTEDPGFEDFNNKDFRLKKTSKAFELGFKEIPISKIGNIKDDYRKKGRILK